MTIFGWDMSHYDAPGIGSAAAEGIVFIVHKAGGDADDQELNDWWRTARPLREHVLLGAYWVLYPDRPVQRADSFLARLDAQCPGWRDGPFILQADCEKWNDDPSTIPGEADITAFCDRLRERAPKLQPIVYAPRWVYGDRLTGLSYPLWASSYVTGSGGFKDLYPGDDSGRWAPYSGQTPAILQYSSKATIGGQTTSDANAYRGTVAELTTLLAPGWTESLVATLDKDDKTYLETTIGPLTDVVPRWTNDGTRVDKTDPNPEMQVKEGIFYTGAGVRRVENMVTAMTSVLAAILANVQDDDTEKDELLAAVEAAKNATIQGVIDELTAAGRSLDDVAAALVAALGPEKAAALRDLLPAE